MLAIATALLVSSAGGASADDTIVTKASPSAHLSATYDWSGFYAGAHLGYAWGHSDWQAGATDADVAASSGTLSLFQPFDWFAETGSYFGGIQAGYDRMLANHVVVGVVADASFPTFPNLDGISIGGTSTFFSPTLGPESYSETMLAFGTVRGRIGYAAENWLLYATGGFAWAYDQLTLTQFASGTTESPFLWRFGWAAGAGVEVPILPHWSARLEYLFTDYGLSSVTFPVAAQRFDSNFSLQELRAGLNYRFGNVATASSAATTPDEDWINIHGQTTFVEQAYPTFRSPYAGVNSLPGRAEGRETWDASINVGVRLWPGAELWIEPELDQGFGFANTHGAAGFPSAEAFKIGSTYPSRGCSVITSGKLLLSVAAARWLRRASTTSPWQRRQTAS